MTTRVLITGIAGFIGSHVVDRLSRKKFDIFGIDDLSTGNIENLRHNERKVEEIMTENIINPAAVYAAFEKYKPDVVIHLAAQPSLLASMKSPEYDAGVNILGTINTLRACEIYQVDRLIFTSTSAITDDCVVQEGMYHKMSPPDTPYGMSKRVAEQYIHLLGSGNMTILRLGNVYGPRQVPLGENQLIPRIIKHLLYGDHFEIYGDGTQTRDYVYAEDVADLIYRIVSDSQPFRHSMNVATGENHSVLEVCELVAKALGQDYVPVHGEAKDQRQNVKMKVYHANCKYGWMAKHSLEAGIKKTAAWWKEQNG